MKRKADDALNDAEATAPKKRAAVGPAHLDWFRDGLFNKEALDKLVKSYTESKP